MESIKNPHISQKILLHVCCAPCSCAIIQTLLEENYQFDIFFYNPNIDTPTEYLKRKQEVIRFAQKKHISFIDMDYEHHLWLDSVKGYEQSPEKGKRCDLCFDMRLQKTAQYAHQHHYPVFATTNGISRHKNIEQVNAAGIKAASLYPSLIYWDRNWRKNNALLKARDIIQQEGFYRQDYCGCEFSKTKTASLNTRC